MLKTTTLCKDAQRRLVEITSIVNIKEKAIEKAPEGKIHIIKTRTKMQYYLRSDSRDIGGKYISRKKEKLIQKLIQKSYDEKILSLLKKEIKTLESFLKQYKNIDQQIKDVYSTKENEIKINIIPIDCSDEDYANMWQNIPFVSNPYPPTGSEYKTNRKEIVRSKSELNIANALNKHGIPYKYECQFKLKDGSVVYPDFTLLDLKNRREIYWEHRGMMDDREYVKKSVKKIKDYNKSGVIAGNNLIITEEMYNSMLGTDEIDNIIEKLLSE